MQKNRKRRTSAATRKQMLIKRLNIIKAVLAAVAVFVVVYYIQAFAELKFGRDVFYAGTYVNGISLEGMSYDQAMEKLTENSQAVLSGTSFHLYYGDQEWYISTADLDAKLDVEEILDQAWNYGREGSISERRNQVRALRSNPIVLASDLEYDQEELKNFIYLIKEEIDIEPVEAYVTVEGFEKLSVSQSYSGLMLDADTLIDDMIEAMTVGGDFDIELQPKVTQPMYTTEVLKKATQCLSKLATPTTSSSSKRTSNIKTALSNFNGMCIPAGVQISFNEIVGSRTMERGYLEAPEYAGTSLAFGIGGGTCQASSTLYCNLVYAGLQIDERHPHSMIVTYTKPSLDAAVNDTGTKDLVFTNNTGYPIYIFTDVDAERAYVSIFGMPSEYEIEIVTEVTERDIKSSKVTYKKDTTGTYVYYTDEQMFASAGKLGRRSQALRYFKKDGEIITEERLSSDYYEAQPDVYWVGVHERTAG